MPKPVLALSGGRMAMGILSGRVLEHAERADLRQTIGEGLALP